MSPTLTSIPECVEIQEDTGQKWVPKKKHEVLKAKYKCLKKLFQIYDANVIEGFLPDPNLENEENPKRRKKRSHRTKTDACAGTTETSCGDLIDKESISTSTDSQIDTQADSKEDISKESDSKTDTVDTSLTSQKSIDYPDTINSEENFNNHESKDSNINYYANSEDLVRRCKCQQNYPYLLVNDRRKPTRFQCFLQRIFGIRSVRRDPYFLPNQYVYAASDTCVRRRRKCLRFRRLKRTKKHKSDSDLKELRNPIILSYVQSVQKNCLMDKTPRQCPIVGCQMVSCGIINYNDHLNLCHFKDRRFSCHYCHAGFENLAEKVLHENEHIGFSKLSANVSSSSTYHNSKKVSITQTDPACSLSDEKLKKIVSFIDKIDLKDDLKKLRCSESNLNTTESSESDKRTVSCLNMNKKPVGHSKKYWANTAESSPISSKLDFGVNCQHCGEHFNNRRQLTLHIDLEHRLHSKFSKFHSCAGIMSTRPQPIISQDGRINFLSKSNSCIHCLTEDSESIGKSDLNLTSDPSTDVVCFTSMETVKKLSRVKSLVRKVRSYKWEPGTKIIRV